MSCISIDLKVIEVHAPMVARTLGEPVAVTLGGLNLLWHRCWSTKATTISRIGLAGIFGPDQLDLRIDALIDAGFLERQDDTFRIRGAEKYLRVREGNSKGGHASKRNLIPGGKKAPKQAEEPRGGAEKEAEDPAEREPRGSREGAERGHRLDLASSPITDHRSPRGSMSSPRRDLVRDLADERPAPEDIQTQGGYDSDARATAFIAWAKALDPELADPGPGVTTWARDFYAKYQPADDTGIQAAFGNFLLWAHQARKRPGWGLWLSENVWLERWNTVRAEQRGAA